MVDAGRDQPDRGRRRRGPLLLGLRREALPRLRVAARQRQHRPPAPEDHRGDQGAGGQALHDRAADGVGVALAARAAARGGHAGRPLHVVLHELAAPRRTRTRSSSRGSDTGRHKIIARYRSYHGATHGSIMLTGDPRRWPNEPGMGGVVRMLDPYTYRCPAGPSRSLPRLLGRAAPRGDPRVRGRAHGRRGHPRDGHRDERDHPAARRLPAGDPRGLRPARDPADPRRGHGRLRPHRAAGSRARTGTSSRTSSRSRRASTPATCRSAR